MADCGHRNPPTHRYCVICGEVLHRISCPRCSQVGLPQFLYCSDCGYPFKNAALKSLEAAGSSTEIANKEGQENNDIKADLDELLSLLDKQKKSKSAGPKNGKMSQADIKALLKQRTK